MSRFTISQAYQPTQEELSRWEREAQYFAYQEPNRNSPSSSAAAKGWGVHADYKPPVDAVSYVTAMFKRDVAAVSSEAVLRPEFKWSVFSVCLAHFLWLRTEAGANWLLRFYGVEEVPPFKEAYLYVYLNRTQVVNGEPQRVPIGDESGLEMRSFRSCERELDPPITSQHDAEISEMQALLRKARDPNASELIAEATADMYHWVSEQLRDWFLEPKADTRWPTHKPDRISGPRWARELKRSNGARFYEALAQVELHQGRAYRLRDRQGTVLWCGSADIRFMLRSDNARINEGLSEHNIEGLYQCSSCGKVRTCTPVTRSQKMCCHCFGSIVERDTRPTLDWCTMKECKNCPDHLETKADLVNLKNRLNREASFPVRR